MATTPIPFDFLDGVSFLFLDGIQFHFLEEVEVAETPTERIYSVLAEDRGIVPVDNRELSISDQDRGLIIPDQIRDLEIKLDDRTLEIKRE